MVLVSQLGSGRERTRTVCGATKGPARKCLMEEHDLGNRNRVCGGFLDDFASPTPQNKTISVHNFRPRGAVAILINMLDT